MGSPWVSVGLSEHGVKQHLRHILGGVGLLWVLY